MTAFDYDDFNVELDFDDGGGWYRVAKLTVFIGKIDITSALTKAQVDWFIQKYIQRYEAEMKARTEAI